MVVTVTWERAGAGIPTHTLRAGYTEILSHAHNDGSTDARLSVAYKIATAAGVQRYQAYDSSTATPAWWTGVLVLKAGTFSGDPLASSVTQTGTGVPNPPALSGLDVGNNYLVAAVAAWHLGSSVTLTTTAPAGYTLQWDVAGNATGDVALATKTVSAVASVDPGTFGDNQTPNGSASMTIAFPGPATVRVFSIPQKSWTAGGTYNFGPVAVPAGRVKFAMSRDLWPGNRTTQECSRVTVDLSTDNGQSWTPWFGFGMTDDDNTVTESAFYITCPGGLVRGKVSALLDVTSGLKGEQ